MANWQYRLNLKDLWKAKEEGNITIQELGKKVAERIENLPCFKKYEDDLKTIIMDFETVESVEEFDYILEELYDWGDMRLPTPQGQMQRKMCWISTF